ncbi:hypothetical protein [Haloarcula marina]|uniref:hypothetical protein n=1 Tax=Haloarcula marina TaxID=2961574 RepID=UPI0020B7E3FB|nr:hypothetical protein [Halomicroarcula marina]
MDEDSGGMGDAVTGGTKDGEIRSSLTSVGDSASPKLKTMGYNVEVDKTTGGPANAGTSLRKYALYLSVVLTGLVLFILLYY